MFDAKYMAYVTVPWHRLGMLRPRSISTPPHRSYLRIGPAKARRAAPGGVTTRDQRGIHGTSEKAVRSMVGSIQETILTALAAGRILAFLLGDVTGRSRNFTSSAGAKFVCSF